MSDPDDARLADALARARQAAGERDAALRRVRQLERDVLVSAALRGAETRHVDALASHTRQLQRQVLDLLGSRRWAMGSRLGDAVDRVLRRRREIGEDDRIRELVEEGGRILGALVEERARQAVTRRRAAAGYLPGREQPSAGGEPDLLGFFCRSVVDPLVETPFDEAARHAIVCMEAYRDHLVGRLSANPPQQLVSVIMPTHQRAHLLPRAIGSVLAQSYERWELIVVDDGSTDDTQAVLSSYRDERIVTVALDGNHGVSHARNRGLEQARGEILAYLDSDNYWDEHYLLLMAGALHERPGREAAYCAQEIWQVGAGEGDETLREAEVPTGDARERRLDGIRFAPFNRSLLENRNYIDLNAFVHRRDLLERHGAFDETLPRLVDWDLFLRYTEDARPVALPCLLSTYEFGTAGDQLTRTLPVGPATAAIDSATLQRAVLDVTLPREAVARYGKAPLFAPPGSRRSGRPRPVTVAVTGAVGGGGVQACMEAVRTSTPGADLRFVVARGASSAVAAAGGRDLVLLDAEVVVVPGWLEACWEVIDTVGDAGLVVPRVTLPPDAPGSGQDVPYAKTHREVDVSLSLAGRNVADPWLDEERGFVELAWARFTCAYLPAASLAATGPPPDLDDPDAAARVYGDLLRTLWGRRVVYTPHGKVYHLP